MAAMTASTARTTVNGNGRVGSPGRDDEGFHDAMLHLRDAVLSRSHPRISLPQSAIDALKASLIAPGPGVQQANGDYDAALQEHVPGHGERNGSLGGEQYSMAGASAAQSSLANNVGKMAAQQGLPKRKQIERDLVARVGERKRARQIHDPQLLPATKAAAIRRGVQQVVPHVSGLKARSAEGKRTSSSFDENDYYSSLVESDWTSEGEVASDKAADQAAGSSLPFTADFEQLGNVSGKAPAGPSSPVKPFTFTGQQQTAPHPTSAPQEQGSAEDDDNDDDDDDDDYTPPPAAAFDSYRGTKAPAEERPDTAASFESSEYDPGDITAGSFMAFPQVPAQQPAPASQDVPIVRNNRLTQIAAPQPNRVSPLAISQNPDIEYEYALVKGCPELVPKPGQGNRGKPPGKKAKRAHPPMETRHSSPSPPPTRGQVKNSKKNKKANKKRKQEQENEKSAKKRRQNTPPGSTQQDSYIKPEPTSPESFANVPRALTYEQRPEAQSIDLVSPRQPVPLRALYEQAPHAPYGYDSAPSSAYASPAPVRYTQRDNQDLRRVASMQYAQQRPASPPQDRRYSPVGPYLQEHRRVAAVPSYRYEDGPVMMERAREDDRAFSAMMPPPPRLNMPRLQQPGTNYAEPSPRVIVDANGVKYYAAPPPQEHPAMAYERAPSRMMSVSYAPAPQSGTFESVAPRASMAPPARHLQQEPAYIRAPSRAVSVYDPQPAYEQRMAPPPPPARRPQPVEYVDAQGYRVDAQGYRIREYSTRPAESVAMSVGPQHAESAAYRYSPEHTSPVHQYAQREQAPPREETAPVYAAPRAYSVMPEPAPQPVPHHQLYAPRQASVAPVQYAPHREMAPPSAPARAVSVMPAEHAPQHAYHQPAPVARQQYAQQPREYSYSQAPQTAPEGYEYVDQYGRVVEYQ